MGQRPLTEKTIPSLVSALWFSFDSAEEDKELWILEQEVASELERVEQRHSETLPVGKSGNESYVDEDEDEDEEEDDNDDEESESHDDDDDEEIDMDVEDHDSPTF
ncbi:unnamed protein product [Orchesella dallaii]|uniref:Uncharacterized protein n=1 Tax=Orchesella dallaii TaxID=48710 RepID=A0ABP1PYM5_9HEXA